MAKLLSNFGDVRNQSVCMRELRNQIPEFKSASEALILKKVNERANELSQFRYFTYDYIELEENEAGKNVMWVDTGYKNILGSTVYAQFTGSGCWTGALIGSEETILEYQKNYRSGGSQTTKESLEKELGISLTSIEGVNVILDDDDNEKVEQVATKTNKNEVFLQSLYSKLLIPHSWTLEQLDNYINLCISRLNNLISKGSNVSDYFIFNNDLSLALFNSGLLDRFGKYIYVVTPVYSKDSSKSTELGYTGLRFGNSKVSLCEDGFIKSDLNRTLQRVAFADSLVDLIFQAEFDDFDLDSRSRLEHCIIERKERFPESISSASMETICSDIERAIEIAVNLSKCDRNYIKPIYNRKRDSIDFVIPYHVNHDFQKKPEMGIVVALHNGYWQIMTVLEYDAVMKDIKLFNMYENETF